MLGQDVHVAGSHGDHAVHEAVFDCSTESSHYAHSVTKSLVRLKDARQDDRTSSAPLVPDSSFLAFDVIRTGGT